MSVLVVLKIYVVKMKRKQLIKGKKMNFALLSRCEVHIQNITIKVCVLDLFAHFRRKYLFLMAIAEANTFKRTVV